LVDRHHFEREVRRLSAERHAKGFSCLYFPRKTGHGKRLGLLTHFGLLCKQKVSSFACREALSY